MKDQTLPNHVSSISSKEAGGYQTGFICWRAAENDFSEWTLQGVKLSAGALEFDPTTAAPGGDPYAAGTYDRGNYYNGRSFFVGEATSPEISATFDYKQAIASWNAATPPGSWLEIQFRAGYGTRWSKWYGLGIWASDDSTIRRHSIKAQEDQDGRVADDTFISANEEQTPDRFQLKLRLFSADGMTIPSVRNASVTYSTSKPGAAGVSGGNPACWNTLLKVPAYSQMVYPDGGSVWCSPTSTAMVLSFYEGYTGAPAPRVHAAVEAVYDWVYDGHGNWPFNTAYAATFGYEGYVARFTSLARAEEYVAAGVPVILSVAWKKGELTGADVDSTNGHLVVLVGFDAAGNPIINDPASPANETVQRTYLRSEFEPLWLQASGGTVYLIYPQAAPVPVVPQDDRPVSG